jgi:hypothetical protein
MLNPRLIALAILFVMTAWFGHLASKPLECEGRLMMKLELSFTPERLNQLLAVWKQKHTNWQAPLLESLRWDTWFICAYAPFCCLLVWVAAEHFQTRNPGLNAFGYCLAAAQLFAGVCDLIENAGLKAAIISGKASSPWTQIMSSFSAIKWLILLAAALFAFGALIDWAVNFPHEVKLKTRLYYG